MKLFTKSWKNDYPWLKLALKSASKLCRDPIHWTIVVDQGEKTGVQKVISQAMQEAKTSFDYVVYELQEFWPEVNGINGYYAQQWIKMNAHMVMGDGIFFNWDSDVIAVRPFSEKDFYGKSERPIFWISQFNHLLQHGNHEVHRARINVMREVCSVPEVGFEYMRCMPIPMNGAILRSASSRQEWSKSLNAIKNTRGGFSEFNIIGLFSHLYFPDAYEWRNADTQGPAWAGGWDQNGNCFQEHALISQRYSWGGMEKHIEDFVNAL